MSYSFWSANALLGRNAGSVDCSQLLLSAVLPILLIVSGCATAPSTQLYVAVRDGNYSDAKRVVDRNAPQINMCNLLDKSIGAGRGDFVSSALRDGANPNCTSSGFSVLYTAVALKCTECARALVLGGARINDSGGAVQQTPLDTAYVTGNRQLIQLISSRGGVRNISDSQVAKTQENIRKAELQVEDEPPPAPTPMPAYQSSIGTGVIGAPPAYAINRQASVNGGSQQAAKISKPLVNNCVQVRRRSDGLLELYNGCGFTVNYNFCLQGGNTNFGGAYACSPSVDSKGMDFLGAGKTSEGFRANSIVFAACEGGPSGGNYSSLHGGRGECK